MPNGFSPSVLITGANGFIGSRLCRAFLHEGWKVVAGVRKTGDLSLLRELSVEYRYGDITTPETLPEMVREVDYIVHNAGLVKAKSRAQFFEVNETGTRNLLEATIAHNPSLKKLVLISSMAAAGPSIQGRPLTEADPPHPITVYGESKLAGEKAALDYANRVPLVILRPSGVYGPGDEEIMAIFKTVKLRIRPAFGNQKRKIQLTHVDDLCRAVIAATKAATASGAAYFVAENRAYPMADMLTIMEQACGRRGFPLLIPGWFFRGIAAISEFSFRIVGATPMLTREKANELLETWEISTEKARRELGFESQISFAVGAKQTFDWYREHRWL
ncbi:MAG: SDR family NAD(P)-dependent oxidoreductase [Candidatus Zixiibacteriota bacterium]